MFKTEEITRTRNITEKLERSNHTLHRSLLEIRFAVVLLKMPEKASESGGILA